MGTPGPPASEPDSGIVGISELFRTFFVIGLTSFGMAILQNMRTVPVKRGWLAREDIDEGLGLVQMYPGAMLVDLAAYIGYRKRRVPGAVAAVAGFVTPSLLLVLGLSWLYWERGLQAHLDSVVVGLDAIVIGVIVNMALDFADQYGRGWIEALLAVGALAVGVAGANLLWAVLGALIIGAALLRREAATPPSPPPITPALNVARLAVALIPGAFVLLGGIAAAFSPGPLAALVADMTKIGSVAFGNGATILPVLQQDVVTTHHWLSAKDFGVGIALGQATPGPLLITATFVGFRVAGWWGGVLAAVAIFAPSVAMTTVMAELYPYLRRVAAVRGAIRGVMAAFVGLLAVVVFSIGDAVRPVPAAWLLALAVLVAARWLKWNVPTLFAAGLALWAIYLMLGGAA
jgi:chromate transporter